MPDSDSIRAEDEEILDDHEEWEDEEWEEEGDDIGNRIDGRNSHQRKLSYQRHRRSSNTGNIMEVHRQYYDDGILGDQKVAILVDVQNMYHSARKIYGENLSYKKLLDIVVADRLVTRAIAYVSEREDVDQSKFYGSLHSIGFDIQKRRLKDRGDGQFKDIRGSWQVEFALDAIRIAKRVDSVILVTGDGDFIPLVNALKQDGVRVEIACFRDSASDTLLSTADSVHFLGKEHLYDRLEGM